MRLPEPTPTIVRRLCAANLVGNVGIILTGGAVRLTGSGLGCPTWPLCTEDSFVPTKALPINATIEFTNRTLTGVVSIIAAATLLMVWRLRPARRDLRRPTLFVLLGIPTQGLIGGITVLTGLNPYTVMVHFLLSSVLVSLATVAWVRSRRAPYDGRVRVGAGLHRMAAVLVASTYATLVLGTIVTGSGPHGGDPKAGRTGFDPQVVSMLHADSVFLLVGLTVALAVLLKALRASHVSRRAVYLLLGLEVGQGIVGYVQYFTGLPIGLVAVHLLGAACTVSAATAVWTHLREPTYDDAAGRSDSAQEPPVVDGNADGFGTRAGAGLADGGAEMVADRALGQVKA